MIYAMDQSYSTKTHKSLFTSSYCLGVLLLKLLPFTCSQLTRIINLVLSGTHIPHSKLILELFGKGFKSIPVSL